MDVQTYELILGRLPSLRGSDAAVRETKQEVHQDGVMSYQPSYVYRAFTCCCGRLLGFIGDEGARKGYNDPELKLRLDMTVGKAAWYGEYWKDLWCWTQNCNPLLALFYSHPLHPVSRAERIFITCLHSVFIMMISSATPRARECMDIAGDVCSVSNTCCFCQTIGLTFFVRAIPGSAGGTVFAVIANTIFAQLLYQLGAGCSCMQDRLPEVRRCSELMGHLFMFLVLLAMIFPTAMWLSYNSQHNMLGATIKNFVINKPFGMLGTTALQSAIFTLKWRHQTQEGSSSENYERFFITSSDYWAHVTTSKRKAPP